MGVDMTGASPQMDYDEHQRTYRLFVRGTVILTVATVVILALLGIFLV